VKCPLCVRETDPKDMSDHHLVPKSKGGRDTETICHPCHRQIHALFDNRRLAKELDSVEALLAEPTFAKYLKWASKQTPGKRFKTKAAKGNKRRR
jgi:5-methylcytosine-specific restriction endonuclease McrA